MLQSKKINEDDRVFVTCINFIKDGHSPEF